MEIRVGQGIDIHQLVPDRSLILGGVSIPHEFGLQGHSDADVLLHAITDALLGAAGLGDLGAHFPDTDEQYRGADSSKLLGEVVQLLREQGWQVVNIDATVLAEAPKLSPYREQMQENISAVVGIPPDCCGVKATTGERLGFVGRKEGIMAMATALIRRP